MSCQMWITYHAFAFIFPMSTWWNPNHPKGMKPNRICLLQLLWNLWIPQRKWHWEVKRRRQRLKANKPSMSP
ncbi:hypothetical protein M758_UG314600 [Ceratodon purpureus]|nr:hypothetical protein M758_UG314600 [Ceratodon purpureus]